MARQERGNASERGAERGNNPSGSSRLPRQNVYTPGPSREAAFGPSEDGWFAEVQTPARRIQEDRNNGMTRWDGNTLDLW